MNDKYIAKVVSIIDEYTVVINGGNNIGIKNGDRFQIIELGDIIRDPDTNEELEQLEILKGKVEATHVQEKIATLKSCQYAKAPDKREIKKVTTLPRGIGSIASIVGGFGSREHDTVTESITPGESHLIELNNVKQGDLIIKA